MSPLINAPLILVLIPDSSTCQNSRLGAHLREPPLPQTNGRGDSNARRDHRLCGAQEEDPVRLRGFGLGIQTFTVTSASPHEAHSDFNQPIHLFIYFKIA